MLVYAIKDCFAATGGTYKIRKKIITKDKYYKVLKQDSIGYYVEYDTGFTGWVSYLTFENVDETRERKLNQIKY